MSNAQPKSGVFGFNTKQQGTGYGVFGRCDATAPSIHDRLTSIRDVAQTSQMRNYRPFANGLANQAKRSQTPVHVNSAGVGGDTL